MSTEVEEPEVAPALRAMQEQLAALAQRIDTLERSAAAAGAAPVGAGSGSGATRPAQVAADAATAASLDEATLLAISAAIAAFLGKKASIRQIRLITSPSWARQGRLSIHTSHALTRSGLARSGAAS